MGFDIGAALLGADFLGGAAAAAPEVAADVAPIAFDVGGETAAAIGGGDVLAAGAGDVLAGGAGVGAGLGAADLGAAGGAAGAATAADLGAVGLDVTGVDLGLASPAAGTADAASSLGGVTTLPNVQPLGLGGGPAAPTIGATQVSDLTTQDLNTVLTGDPINTEAGPGPIDDGPAGPETATADTGVGKVPPTPNASQGDMLLPQAKGGVQAGIGGGTQTPGLGGGGGGAGGKGGGFDWWKAAGLGLAAAPLALTLSRGQQTMPEQGTQAQALDASVGAAGQQLLQSGLSNTPTPGQQAVLTANRQGMINAARQQLYNAGVQNPEADSRWPGIVANIDNQINQQLNQYITSNLQTALSATGQASGNLTSLAQQQINLDNAYTAAIANAGRSLGTTVGLAGTRLL